MDVNSIKPMLSLDIFSFDFDPLRGHLAHFSLDGGVDRGAELGGFDGSDRLTLFYFRPGGDGRGGGLSGMLAQLDSDGTGPEVYLLERSFLLVVFDLKTAAKLAQRHATIFLHRVHLDGPLLHEFESGGAAVALTVVAGFLGVEVL